MENRPLAAPPRQLNVLDSALSVSILPMEGLRAAAALLVLRRTPTQQLQHRTSTLKVRPFATLVYREPGPALRLSLADLVLPVHGTQQLALSHHQRALSAGLEATVSQSAVLQMRVACRAPLDTISLKVVSNDVCSAHRAHTVPPLVLLR
jgi:hypothetical protein